MSAVYQDYTNFDNTHSHRPSHERKKTLINIITIIWAQWPHTNDDFPPLNLCCSRWLETSWWGQKCRYCRYGVSMLSRSGMTPVHSAPEIHDGGCWFSWNVKSPDHKPQLHSVSLSHQDAVQVTHHGPTP